MQDSRKSMTSTLLEIRARRRDLENLLEQKKQDVKQSLSISNPKMKSIAEIRRKISQAQEDNSIKRSVLSEMKGEGDRYSLILKNKRERIRDCNRSLHAFRMKFLKEFEACAKKKF